MLRKQLRPAIVMTLLLIVITGFIYPGIVTAIAQVFFPNQANGSLVLGDNGEPIGSALIGQAFNAAYYFHSRPSGAGSGYVGDSSGGTNLGPTSRKLADTLIGPAVDAVVKNDGGVRGHIPSDMVTSSGSGLDPDISPANAALQVARVARERKASPEAIQSLVAAHTTGRQFDFLGETRVNVLLLNLALDSAFPRHASAIAVASGPPSAASRGDPTALAGGSRTAPHAAPAR